MSKILTRLFLCVTPSLILIGCASTPSQATGEGSSGSRLWAQNCARCHNSRPSTDYSPAKWDVAMLHMRIRANLTSEEHKKIREFLTESN